MTETTTAVKPHKNPVGHFARRHQTFPIQLTHTSGFLKICLHAAWANSQHLNAVARKFRRPSFAKKKESGVGRRIHRHKWQNKSCYS